MSVNKVPLLHELSHWYTVSTDLLFGAITDVFAMAQMLLARPGGLFALNIAVLAAVTVHELLARPGGLLAMWRC